MVDNDYSSFQLQYYCKTSPAIVACSLVQVYDEKVCFY